MFDVYQKPAIITRYNTYNIRNILVFAVVDFPQCYIIIILYRVTGRRLRTIYLRS